MPATMPEESLYFKCLGIMTLRGFWKFPELLIPYYKLSTDYYNHAVRINLTQQAGLAV